MSDGIHLTEYHERVRQWLVDKFSWLKLVESYPELTTPLNVPCAFFSVLGWEKDDYQTQSSALTVNLSCEIIAVLGLEDEKHQIEVRNAAMAISIAVEGAQFGLPVSPAVFISAEPDAFDPDLDAYAAWSIRFNQIINVGNDFFEPEGETPSGVNVGYSPDIGADNEDKYESLTP
ncbi:hypothetical protein NMT00_000174 [Vibrio cholerae]|nr:hypothetical protein [Vibrio cholerae]